MSEYGPIPANHVCVYPKLGHYRVYMSEYGPIPANHVCVYPKLGHIGSTCPSMDRYQLIMFVCIPS